MSGKDYVRVTYTSKKDGKQKFLQTLIKKHGTKEKAKEYLMKLKLEKLKAESGDVIETSIETPIENDSVIDTTGNENETNNLMDEKLEISGELDRIIANLKFSPFKLEVDPHETGSSITIFGSSKSYKTTLLKRILKDYYEEDTITLLCAQNVHSKIYKDISKDVIKMDTYSGNLVKAMYKINKKTENKYPFVVAIDDIIDEKNDKDLEKMFLTLRNAKISVIILLQHIALLKSSARSNSNIVIFRKFNQSKTVEDYVMKHYLGNFYPFKDLRMSDKVNLYMKITNNHDFFVLDVLNNTLTVHHEPDLN